jgi:hypothetical protein
MISVAQWSGADMWSMPTEAAARSNGISEIKKTTLYATANFPASSVT